MLLLIFQHLLNTHNCFISLLLCPRDDGAHLIRLVQPQCKFKRWVQERLCGAGEDTLRVTFKMPVGWAVAHDVKATCNLNFMTLLKCGVGGASSSDDINYETRMVVASMKLSNLSRREQLHRQPLQSEPGCNSGYLAIDVTLTFDLTIQSASLPANEEFHIEAAEIGSLRDLLEEPEVFYVWLVETSKSKQLPATIPFGLANLRNRSEGSSNMMWLTVFFPEPTLQGCLDVHRLISEGAYVVCKRAI